MSRAGKAKTRSYWGCTTFGCEVGFNGTEEALPEDLDVCPKCGGELEQITVTRKDEPLAPVAPEVPPDVRERVDRHARAERLFMACKFAIIARDRPLWPGEYIGASIAETWMQALQRRLAEVAQAARIQT